MKNVLSVIISILLGLLFIYTGVVKITGISSFYHNVTLYHLLPDVAAWYWAHYLPWLEVTAGMGLWLKQTRAAACVIIASLLLVFILAIVSAMLRGLHIECGCFGKGARSSDYTWILVRDALLLVASLYLLRLTATGPPQTENVTSSG